ncbi:MAG: C39 family peptidase [Synergistaceae bacterium]|nr:C39 family peptidase [Synergistaceae bacterium]
MKIKNYGLRLFLIICFALLSPALCRAEDEDNTIPYPKSYDIISNGASAYQGVGDYPGSPYFTTPDFYKMKNHGGLTIITGYKTYQQTKETTCGPACALTVLYHYGVKNFHELQLAKEMGTLTRIDEKGELGTSTEKMSYFFRSLGWDVQSSLTSGDKTIGRSFKSPDAFKDFAVENLKNNTPIMVENMYWGGHWRVVIGYDTMDTDATADDMIIFMDSYDVTDHCQDGYAVQSAEGFFYTWLDVGMLPRGQQVQQWVIAKPKKK